MAPQGTFEISGLKSLNEEQTNIIKNHLNLVFSHDIDKQYKEGDGSQEIHDGKKPYFMKYKGQLMRC